MPRKASPAQVRKALREYMRRIAVEGGRKGGKARAKNMTVAQRSAAARRAVNARWAKAKKEAGATC